MRFFYIDAVHRFVFAGLFVAATSTAFAQSEWKPKCNMDKQLFPSLILATATVRPEDDDDEPDPQVLGDRYGLLGISFKASPKPAEVKVTVRENKLMNASSWSGKLQKGSEHYFIAPKIDYKFDQLRRVRQQEPLNVTFAVEVNGKAAGEQIETLNVRSVNDCPWAVLEVEETIADEPQPDEEKPKETAEQRKARNAARAQKEEGTVLGRLAARQVEENEDESEEEEEDTAEEEEDAEEEKEEAATEWEDLGWMGAAYVNEGSPVLDEILNEALDGGWTNAFAGYQRGPDDVLREVLAIWGALQRRGIRYSSVTVTPGGSERVHSQHIRFIDESLTNKQANCADGSVLFCSILRKLGLRTFLVYVPGHMYMGVYLKPEGDEHIAIETTMLGNPASKPTIVKELRSLNASLPRAQRESSEWQTFAAAVQAGTSDLREKAEKFTDEENVDYQIVEIDEARRDGIMPIAYEKY